MPDGTVVMTPEGEVLADLVGPGTRFVAAAGGRGGLGNAALASAARKAPGFALLGEPGEARDFVLELRSIADVGLVGFPSAGKSSLVAALSAARPKIADYPFTTLVPQLGVVTAGEEVFTVADVPGLIPGASEGRGLGLDFLRHIERCSVLVHVVDCATFEPGRDPVSDVQALEDELARYTPALGGALADRPRLIALNKMDVPDARELAELVRPELAERFGRPVFEISTATREGLRELTFAMAEQVRAHRAAQPVAEPTRVVLRPTAVDDAGFTVEPDPELPGGFVVRGSRPGALDPADELRQRRGRGLPRRPAGPARGRGGARRRGCGAGLPGDDRRRHLRLGAVDARRRRGHALRARHGPAAGPELARVGGGPAGGPHRAAPAPHRRGAAHRRSRGRRAATGERRRELPGRSSGRRAGSSSRSGRRR